MEYKEQIVRCCKVRPTEAGKKCSVHRNYKITPLMQLLYPAPYITFHLRVTREKKNRRKTKCGTKCCKKGKVTEMKHDFHQILIFMVEYAFTYAHPRIILTDE